MLVSHFLDSLIRGDSDLVSYRGNAESMIFGIKCMSLLHGGAFKSNEMIFLGSSSVKGAMRAYLSLQ